LKTLYDLFIHELKDLYGAAENMHQVLKRMSSSASNPKLSQMLDTYYYQVEHQQEKLKTFFIKNGINFEDSNSPIMSKISDHGLASMGYEGSKEIRDLALLLTVNMMKHFETTAFGTLLTHANRLEKDDIVDLLLSLKKKIAEDEEKPLEIASAIIESRDVSELKEEIEELLGSILQAQVQDEQELINYLPKIIQEAQSSRLQEALETYQSDHLEYQEVLRLFLPDFPNSSEIDEWSVMEGFTSEWQEHLNNADSGVLKDIGIILSIQRIQHQNMALFEFENLLSDHIENSEMQMCFEKLSENEIGNDQSFTAIAEGSLFEDGLDTKI
jgi:ferritin-like metal-binding protein YciE